MSVIDLKQIEEYKKMHENNEEFGTSALEFIDEISLAIDELSPKTVLDYGCGKGLLVDELEKKYPRIRFYKYDPAISEYSSIPVDRVDLVINTDVLEHIPESDIDDVVCEISKLSNVAYFNLHHALALAVLPNGENAHCTIKDKPWYKRKIGKYFSDLTHLKGQDSYMSVIITNNMSKQFHEKYDSFINRKGKKRFNINLISIRTIRKYKRYGFRLRVLGFNLISYKNVNGKRNLKIAYIPLIS